MWYCEAVVYGQPHFVPNKRYIAVRTVEITFFKTGNLRSL